MVASCNTASHLHIDKAVAQPVAAHQLTDDERKRLARYGRRDPQFLQRAIETIEVRRLVDQLAIAHAHHFVDAVSKLITPILDMNLRETMINITAIHIGITR